MKKIIIFLFVFSLPFVSEAKNLWAFMSYSTFSSPEGSYIETYLTVAGNSVKYLKKENGKYQANVNILMTFKENNVIKKFKKYELNSPEIEDSSKTNFEFVDVQRFPLGNGTYDFEILMSDKNKDIKAQPFSQNVIIDFPKDKPAVSGIELISSYSKSESDKTITKSGYDLVPYVYNFYPSAEKKLSFYCELYNIDKLFPIGQKYILSYYIESFENNFRLTEYAHVKKADVKPVEPMIAEFNIENLSTGNYNLVVEARNQQNELIVSKKSFFQRSNPGAAVVYSDFFTVNAKNTFAENIASIDTLKEYINCTYPISSAIEKSYIKGPLKTGDLKTLQQYFYGFWQRRSSQEPEKAWLAYKDQVHKAQVNFGNKVKKGYQTDRGRVYLQYGAPNTRTTQYNDPNNYPYEIWHYYKLSNNQSNKKFVFFTEDLVLGDFTLLHSDAIGEVNTPGWQRSLRGRVNDPGVMQETETVRAWGDFSDDYWKLPN